LAHVLPPRCSAPHFARQPDDEREMLMRAYVDRLLEHAEEREPAHSPADIDAAVAQFIEVPQTP
jgi:hypothetical protein